MGEAKNSPTPTVCYRCKRRRSVGNEGRITDGSRAHDRDLPAEAMGRWFCSSRCYDETLGAACSALADAKWE